MSFGMPPLLDVEAKENSSHDILSVARISGTVEAASCPLSAAQLSGQITLRFLSQWGAGSSKGGTKQCDECPFSTTYEGAAQALKTYDPQGKAPKKNFPARPIPKDDNAAGGRIMSGFYSKNRIIDGTDDGFLIKVS
ncbi:hypothetical protein [Streptomyces sp. NPDC051214]|uniref:hypothetical protein n=1 Tax=Streptomyces sp. NPDC051214 TaxID=3155282 RepID=UPI00342C9CCB